MNLCRALMLAMLCGPSAASASSESTDSQRRGALALLALRDMPAESRCYRSQTKVENPEVSAADLELAREYIVELLEAAATEAEWEDATLLDVERYREDAAAPEPLPALFFLKSRDPDLRRTEVFCLEWPDFAYRSAQREIERDRTSETEMVRIREGDEWSMKAVAGAEEVTARHAVTSEWSGLTRTFLSLFKFFGRCRALAGAVEARGADLEAPSLRFALPLQSRRLQEKLLSEYGFIYNLRGLPIVVHGAITSTSLEFAWSDVRGRPLVVERAEWSEASDVGVPARYEFTFYVPGTERARRVVQITAWETPAVEESEWSLGAQGETWDYRFGKPPLHYPSGTTIAEEWARESRFGARVRRAERELLAAGRARAAEPVGGNLDLAAGGIHDLGTHRVGDEIPFAVRLRNPGTDTVGVTGLDADCGCLDARISRKRVEPGGYTTVMGVQQILDLGAQQSKLAIEREDGSAAVLQIRYEGRPGALVGPDVVVLGVLERGARAAARLAVDFQGQDALVDEIDGGLELRGSGSPSSPRLAAEWSALPGDRWVADVDVSIPSAHALGAAREPVAVAAPGESRAMGEVLLVYTVAPQGRGGDWPECRVFFDPQDPKPAPSGFGEISVLASDVEAIHGLPPAIAAVDGSELTAEPQNGPWAAEVPVSSEGERVRIMAYAVKGLGGIGYR